MRHLILLLILTITACQTIQVPNWQGYDNQELKKNVERMAGPKVLLGEPKSKFQLASVYVLDPDPIERKKAKPLLQELVDIGDEEAIYFLTTAQIFGYFGEVSEVEYEKYVDIIVKKDADFANTYEKEKKEWQDLINNQFEALKTIYDKTVNLCEQPLTVMPNKLTPTSSYTLPKYLYHCLKSYSFTTDAKPRLLAIADFQELICNQQVNDKICISVGYRNLANGNFSINDTEDQLFVSSAALRSIYQTHKNKFTVYTRNPNNVFPNSQISNMTTEALVQYDKNNIDGAIVIMEKALSNPKLTMYDRAYAERFVGNMYAVKSNEKDNLMAIKYFESALAKNMLPPDQIFSITNLINNLLLTNKEYKKYLVNMSILLNKKTPEFNFIPVETKQKISLIFHSPPSQAASNLNDQI